MSSTPWLIPTRSKNRRLRLVATAFGLALLTFLFRFNTLGGALGGFDDDHFVHFAYVKHVLSGEQPIRDYLGIGLQGAWPALTYETPAAAQRLLGHNLRSEAILTTSAVAAGAALTFLAAAHVAPMFWAAYATALSVFTAPKLYNYPKVALLAAAALLIVRYASGGRPVTVAGCALVTAVAFLFRHDYAVYVGAGFGAAMLAGATVHGRRTAARDVILYAGLTLALLAPSLLYVEQHRGLGAYLSDARAMSRREAAKTEGGWPAYAADEGPLSEQNAVFWAYAGFVSVPAVFVLVGAARGRSAEGREWVAMAGLVAMTSVASWFMLRGNVGARFGDVAPATAVIAAALWGAPRTVATAGARRVTARVVAATTAAMAAACVWVIGSVGRELATGGWTAGPLGVVRRAGGVSDQLRDLPREAWHRHDANGSVRLAQYLNRCTRPTDRVLQLSYQPEIVPFAGRLFAGGVPGLVFALEDRWYEDAVLARLQSEPVPFVIGDEVQIRYTGPEFFPRIREYISSTYEPVGIMRVNGDREFHILATRQRVPSGTFADTNLPCYR